MQTEPWGIEIGTQTEEPEEIVVPKHVKPSLKINGMLMETQKLTLHELPAICDDIKMFNGRLQLLINNETYDISNLPIFK